MLSKVHNGAVAIRNGANGCFATVLNPLSFAQKKKASEFRCFLFWWEEVDSFNSGTGKFTCISGASAPKQVVQAQRAAWCKTRRIHDSQHKKRHRIAMSFFWWEEVDSNHRRRCQQIYSLLPLATRESSHAWSWWSESNQQPADYKSAALPLSHTSEVFGTKTLCRTIRIKMVPWGGVEPPTQGFSVPCSTN